MKNNYFDSLHPVVSFCYLVLIILLTLLCAHPLAAVLSLAGGAVFLCQLKGVRGMLGVLRFALPMLLVIALFNPLFNHRGVTRLFMLFGQYITLEATLYGLMSGTMLASMVIWFACYSAIMSSDKFLYLFGRVAPSASLLITMTLRLIPQLTRQYKQIKNARLILGKPPERLTQKLSAVTRDISALLTWVMEASVVTADSMKARGYGLKRRTAFHLFRFGSRDGRVLGVVAALGVGVVLGLGQGWGAMEFYPSLSPLFKGTGDWAVAALWAVLAFLPSILEAKEAVKWRCYSLKV